MMLLLGLVTLQNPPASPPTVVQRSWRGSQKDSYKVAIDFQDAGGSSSIAFTLHLRAPKNLPKEGSVDVEATFVDQVLTFGKLKKETKGPFGSANLKFAPTGFPSGLLGKGQVGPLMAPLLAWHLPEAVDSEGKYTISEYTTEDGVKVRGTGKAERERQGEWRVANDLAFSEQNATVGALTTIAWFDAKSGRLLRADGSFKAKDGSAEFKVR
ncbi:MAG TPA: hypothetical protein VGE01_12220 [Fimbriimonas sp.]